MTKKELEQLFNLNKEITHDNKWLNNINVCYIKKLKLKKIK